MAHSTIEVKAEYSNHDYVRTVLEEQNAEDRGVDNQKDTYFDVPDGRLKLREGDNEQYLIHYNRTNQDGPKQSDIHLYETGADAAALKEVLTAALGIDVVVKKTREIYFIDNVKFHLDCVDGLGRFIEIEAFDEKGDKGVKQLREQCQLYMNHLDVPSESLVAVSYSDLLRSNC